MKFIFIFLITLLFVGCSLKDPKTCDMKESKIVLFLNLDDGTEETALLLEKIQNINLSFRIDNRKTNIINTNYVEAELFYSEYEKLIEKEFLRINSENSEFKRKIHNQVNVKENQCEIKTVYLNGIDTNIRINKEYYINLND